jgi:hypothetical protein
MKIKLLIVAIAVCMIATPVKADLFGFHLGNLSFDYDGATSVTTMDIAGQTTGSLYRNIAPTSTAEFNAGSWGTGSEDLLISMTLSNIVAPTATSFGTADGTGSISFVDVDGTTIAGTVAGIWVNGYINPATNAVVFINPTFYGNLTTVTSVPVGATFDGHTGSVDMSFNGAPQPWLGSIVQLTATTSWFTPGIDTVPSLGGSIDVSVVPVPAALVLGVLGMGVAGLKLRKFA